jgi:hypothetical protein
MGTIIVLAITALTFFALPVFAADNCYEQKTAMENQVAELASQKARSIKVAVADKTHTRLALNVSQDKEQIAFKKILNMMPYVVVK